MAFYYAASEIAWAAHRIVLVINPTVPFNIGLRPNITMVNVHGVFKSPSRQAAAVPLPSILYLTFFTYFVYFVFGYLFTLSFPLLIVFSFFNSRFQHGNLFHLHIDD